MHVVTEAANLQQRLNNRHRCIGLDMFDPITAWRCLHIGTTRIVVEYCQYDNLDALRQWFVTNGYATPKGDVVYNGFPVQFEFSDAHACGY